MNILLKSAISAACIFSFMQSAVFAEVDDGIGRQFGKSTGNHSSAMGNNHPAMGKGVMPSKMPAMPAGPKQQGKVVEVTNGAGYSYMKLVSGGQVFWIAGTQISANVGDVVSYVENVTMENFTSKTLNKTFDRIVFVSTASVVQ